MLQAGLVHPQGLLNTLEVAEKYCFTTIFYLFDDNFRMIFARFYDVLHIFLMRILGGISPHKAG